MLSRVVWLLPVGLLMAQPAPDAPGIARKALDLFLAQQYAPLNAMLSPSAKEFHTEAALAKLGAQLKTWGDMQKIGAPSVQDMGPVNVVTIPVQFSLQNHNFRMAINASGQVSQFLILPGEVAWQAPDYVKKDSFQSREVTLGDAEWKLSGTLTVPVGKGPFPAVALAPDSGPSDRDASIYYTKVFRDIAEGLSSRGIVVLRYEKRTRQYASRMSGRAYTIDEEIGEDAGKALALLRATPEVDPKKVYLLGYGVGGYIAPRIALEDGKLAGMIVLGANVQPLEDLFLDEAAVLNADPKKIDNLKVQVAKIKKLEQSDSDLPAMLGEPILFWLDLKSYDAAAQAKKLTVPILALGAGRDIQSPPKELELWKTALAANKGADVKSYAALNHLFVAGEGKSTDAEYRKPGHVAVQVVEDIAKFVNR